MGHPVSTQATTAGRGRGRGRGGKVASWGTAQEGGESEAAAHVWA